MTYFQRVLVNMLAFISLTVLFPEMFFVKSFTTALVASIVLSLLNTIIKPILMILSFPLTILTLGFFSFVINALMLQWTSNLVGCIIIYKDLIDRLVVMFTYSNEKLLEEHKYAVKCFNQWIKRDIGKPDDKLKEKSDRMFILSNEIQRRIKNGKLKDKEVLK